MELELIDWLLAFVILDQGIPLFTGLEDKIKLKLLATQKFACGVTELDYKVNR